jgi:hypothetical protein
MVRSLLKSRFALSLVAAFCLSWTGSLLAVYFLVPAVHRIMSAPLFALAGSCFLLGFTAALGLIVLRPLMNAFPPENKMEDISQAQRFSPN